MPLTADQTKEMDLRSEEYKDAIEPTAAAALDAGEVHALENCVAFTLSDIASGAKYTAIVQADKVRAVKAVEAIDAGDTLYWDNGNSVVTKTDSGSLPVFGYALETVVAGSAGDTVLMVFDGRGKALT